MQSSQKCWCALVAGAVVGLALTSISGNWALMARAKTASSGSFKFVTGLRDVELAQNALFSSEQWRDVAIAVGALLDDCEVGDLAEVGEQPSMYTEQSWPGLRNYLRRGQLRLKDLESCPDLNALGQDVESEYAAELTRVVSAGQRVLNSYYRARDREIERLLASGELRIEQPSLDPEQEAMPFPGVVLNRQRYGNPESIAYVVSWRGVNIPVRYGVQKDMWLVDAIREVIEGWIVECLYRSATQASYCDTNQAEAGMRQWPALVLLHSLQTNDPLEGAGK